MTLTFTLSCQASLTTRFATRIGKPKTTPLRSFVSNLLGRRMFKARTAFSILYRPTTNLDRTPARTRTRFVRLFTRLRWVSCLTALSPKTISTMPSQTRPVRLLVLFVRMTSLGFATDKAREIKLQCTSMDQEWQSGTT